MGSCVLREMGLENQEWSSTRKAKLMMHLQKFKEQEQALNEMMEERRRAFSQQKKQRQKEVEKEIRRIQRGGEVSSDDDEEDRDILKKDLPHIDEQEEESSVVSEMKEPTEEDSNQDNDSFFGLIDDKKEPTESESMRNQQSLQGRRSEEEDEYQNELAMYFGMPNPNAKKSIAPSVKVPITSQKSLDVKNRPSNRNKSTKLVRQKSNAFADAPMSTKNTPVLVKTPVQAEEKKFVNTVFQKEALDQSAHEEYSKIFSEDFDKDLNDDFFTSKASGFQQQS